MLHALYNITRTLMTYDNNYNPLLEIENLLKMGKTFIV